LGGLQEEKSVHPEAIEEVVESPEKNSENQSIPSSPIHAAVAIHPDIEEPFKEFNEADAVILDINALPKETNMESVKQVHLVPPGNGMQSSRDARTSAFFNDLMIDFSTFDPV